MDDIIKNWEEKLKDLEADCALIDLEIQTAQREKYWDKINHTELAVKERRLRQFKESLLSLDWTLSKLKESYYPYD